MKDTIISPVPDMPALTIESDTITLVIADLHIGYEYELLKKGINLPSQTNILKERLLKTITATNATNLILLGDIKHNIPTMSALETKTMPHFLELPIPTKIIKGNHDGNIESLSKWPVLQHIVIDDILLTHGHMNIPNIEYSTLIVGHSHPAIDITDELGKRNREKTWIRGILPEGQDFIIIPAFNHLITGTAFNNARFTPPGTLFRKYSFEELSMESYLLDGTYLGSIEHIT